MGDIRKIPITFLANDNADPRHEVALSQFASILNVADFGKLVLAEVLNMKTCQPEYIIAAQWEDTKGEDFRFLPVATLMAGNIVDGLYALPNGKGGWVGVVDSLEEALTPMPIAFSGDSIDIFPEDTEVTNDKENEVTDD